MRSKVRNINEDLTMVIPIYETRTDLLKRASEVDSEIIQTKRKIEIQERNYMSGDGSYDQKELYSLYDILKYKNREAKSLRSKLKKKRN